jgi:hypothetical protein
MRLGGHVVRLFTSMMGSSIVFRRAKGLGFVCGSWHWYIGVIGIHGIGCLSLNRVLPCPTRLASVHRVQSKMHEE